MSSTHPRSENFRWTIEVADHPKRDQSKEYIASRKLMRKIIGEVDGWILGHAPFEDHHGGSVWVKDADGWLFTQLPLGIEWSAQFCADPAKIDKLRVMASRIVRAFPETIPAYEELGYKTAQRLLDTPIKTPAHVAHWTDSIFNASMPVPAAVHTGVLPKGAGYHHYPKPIVDIDHFRRDDFKLFVTDEQGLPAAVVAVSARPGDKRVRLLAANRDSEYAKLLTSHPHPEAGKHRPPDVFAGGLEMDLAPDLVVDSTSPEKPPSDPTLLSSDDFLAKQAFGKAANS